MLARPFLPSDLPTRDAWLSARLGRWAVGRLPRIGLIVDSVACAHLHLSDGDLAVVDDLVASPDASPEDRDDAIRLILFEFERIGETLGIRHVVVLTEHDSLRERCREHGLLERPSVSVFYRGYDHG